MPELIPVLKKNEIEKIVSEISKKISVDYRDRDLILIGVLKGAFVFLSDIIRHLTIPVKVDFIRIASYGDSDSSSGKVKLTKDIEIDIKNKDILIVEDIVDTGLSLNYLIDYLMGFKPKSVKVCAMIDKPERRAANIYIDYPGHVVKKGFLVGYGLDYAENYRHLPAIYHLQL